MLLGDSLSAGRPSNGKRDSIFGFYQEISTAECATEHPRCDVLRRGSWWCMEYVLYCLFVYLLSKAQAGLAESSLWLAAGCGLTVRIG